MGKVNHGKGRLFHGKATKEIGSRVPRDRTQVYSVPIYDLKMSLIEPSFQV